jgi:hypothetical protein
MKWNNKLKLLKLRKKEIHKINSKLFARMTSVLQTIANVQKKINKNPGGNSLELAEGQLVLHKWDLLMVLSLKLSPSKKQLQNQDLKN